MIHFPLDARRRQRWLFFGIVVRSTHFATVGLGKGRFPGCHPAVTFGAVLGLALDHGLVEELRREPGQAAMGAQGASIGGERLVEVARTAPAAAQAATIKVAERAANRAAVLADGHHPEVMNDE